MKLSSVFFDQYFVYDLKQSLISRTDQNIGESFCLGKGKSDWLIIIFKAEFSKLSTDRTLKFCAQMFV